MLLASRFAAAATAAFIFATMDSPAEAASGPCGAAAEVQVLPSPIAPWKGAPLRVMIIAERPLVGAMSLIAPDGSVAAKSSDRHGGSPYFWFAEVAAPAGFQKQEASIRIIDDDCQAKHRRCGENQPGATFSIGCCRAATHKAAILTNAGSPARPGCTARPRFQRVGG